MKKYKKNIMGMTETSLIGASGSIALGGIGGGVATQGQQGIANASRFIPTMGSMVGTGALFKQIKKLEPKNKRRKK